MKCKVLCLGRSAKEVEINDGATVEAAIKAAGFPTESNYSRHVNGHAACDSDVLQSNDTLVLTPAIKGGGI